MNKDKQLSFRQEFKQQQAKRTTRKKHWGLLLIPIFFFVLFMSTYFNYSSGFAYNEDGTTLGTRFYLSGPDPYYNMRLINQTLEQGRYPFIQPHSGDDDPLLNYPVGNRGARPPLFNMIAVGSTLFLENFMSQIDAQGWSMLFLPSIYGALMIFPLYFICLELFNRKVGLIACMLLPLVPSFIGGGHGSGFSLFDHDSFVQLLFILVMFFVIKMIKEPTQKKAIVYASFAGIFTGSIYLTWVASQMIYLVLLVGMLSILIVSLLKKVDNTKIFFSFLVLSTVAFLVGLPWSIVTDDLVGFPLFMIGVSAFVLCLYFITRRINIPWLVSIPSLTCAGFGSLVLLFLVNLGIVYLGGRIYQMSVFFFGEGIYGSKISLTIAEAHTIGLSSTVMSVGPFVYFLGLAGFCLYIVKTYKDKFALKDVFMISTFFVLLWLLTTAGRFLNDLIPYIVLFAGWTILVIIDKLNYKKLRETIGALGFFRGIRRGMSPLRILGVIFIFCIIFTNGFIALDAAVPAIDKEKVFGKGFQGYFGQSLGQSYYWSDACDWLSKQDSSIESDGDKPGVISWWDYGFYLSSQSRHPTVADNYQDGIFPASNFHTAKTEKEAVCVLAIRCIEGVSFEDNYKIPENVKFVIRKYLPDYNTTVDSTVANVTMNITRHPSELFISYFEDPNGAPSYNQFIHPEFGNKVLRTKPENARYHDCLSLLENLTDEEVTNFYMEIKEVTGSDIRYYAVEQYDTQIFNVFTFLSDRSTFGFVDYEDDYMYNYYETPTGEIYFLDQLDELSDEVLSTLSARTNFKPAYFETMFYRTYYGTNMTRVPTYLLKHWSLVYYSPYVIIAKYSEGSEVSGFVNFNSSSRPNQTIYPNLIAVCFDSAGIPHDYSYVDFDGSYSLLLPEGNCSVGMMLGDNTLNATSSVDITENEARRKINHTDIENVTINLASANITVLTNKTGINLEFSGKYFGATYSKDVISNFTYRITDAYPDIYKITATYTNGTIYRVEERFFDTGENKILLNL